MPKGDPSSRTRASEKYQKKAGYKTASFKLKGDVAERFKQACADAGLSQASVLTELMEKFISEKQSPDTSDT